MLMPFTRYSEALAYVRKTYCGRLWEAILYLRRRIRQQHAGFTGGNTFVAPPGETSFLLDDAEDFITDDEGNRITVNL